MKTKETFYIITKVGLVKIDIIRKFICSKRTFVLHKSLNAGNKWGVTDYLTGMSVCSGNTKEYLVRKAKSRIVKNSVLDYNKYQQCNSNDFLDSYFTTMRLLNSGKNRREGIKFAVEIFNNICC